jgi:fumarate hydratase subunit beta
MSRTWKIKTPLTEEIVRQLRSGDRVLLSGVIYTARDAAHKRFVEALDAGEELPVAMEGQGIYYAGPAPAGPGKPIGPVGPTTSYRMDPYAPILIEQGLKVMIGKGRRSAGVVTAMKKFGAVYLGATGGAAALLARTVKEAEVVAYPDLGPEAVRRLVVEEMPLVVVIDAAGQDLYETGPARYRQD